MYSRGEGTPIDYKEALRWYLLSAEQGISGSQSNLGLMYEKGLGVSKIMLRLINGSILRGSTAMQQVKKMPI